MILPKSCNLSLNKSEAKTQITSRTGKFLVALSISFSILRSKNSRTF